MNSLRQENCLVRLVQCEHIYSLVSNATSLVYQSSRPAIQVRILIPRRFPNISCISVTAFQTTWAYKSQFKLPSVNIFSTIMRLSLCAFALGVTATAVVDESPTLVKRDLATVTQVVEAVGQSLSALDQVITSFNGDAAPLNSAAQALEDVITEGASTIQNTPEPLSQTDALALQAPIGALQQQGEQLVANLDAQKDAIQQAGLCGVVREQSTALTTNSQTLIDAIVAKVPQELQSIATQLADGFVQTLQQNEANFAEGSCVDAGGGGDVSPPPTTSGGGLLPPPTSSPTTGGGGGGPPGQTSASRSNSGTLRPTGATPTTGGGAQNTSRPTVVTAAAVANAVPLGGFAFMLAAFMA